jgi:hypothetical protein
MDIPPQLSTRLATAEQSQLVKLLDEVAQFMPRVYQAAVLDHQESRGDDSALFGLRVYKHLRHEAIGVAIADPRIGVVEPNGSYELLIGPLHLRIDVLGHSVHDDVLGCFPDNSPTKMAVGESNLNQMRLDFPEVDVAPTVADYDLNCLTIGHFGNPREGLVKWYLGAWRNTPTGGRRWAWINRQDAVAQAASSDPYPARETVLPFRQRTPDVVEVRPRQGA